MNSLLNLLKKNKHLLLFLYWPFHFVWYQVVRIYADQMPNYFIVQSSLDKSIPFCEWFIIPYSVWYPYIFTVIIYFAHKNKNDFIKINSMLIGCMFFSMVICTVFPSGILESMRPIFETLGRDNILIDAVKYIYKIDDPPRCVMPSMHFSVSAALFLGVMKSECLKGKKLVKFISFTLSSLICLSIVFIKQHSVLDGFAGLAMVTTMYFVTYHWIFRKKKII